MTARWRMLMNRIMEREDAGQRAGLTTGSNGQNCHNIIELTLIFRAW